MVCGDIDVQSRAPLSILNHAVWRRREYCRCVDQDVYPPICGNHFSEGFADRFTVADIDGHSSGRFLACNLLRFLHGFLRRVRIAVSNHYVRSSF